MALLWADGSVSLSKDRWGFRPFVYAQEWWLLVASSESSTLFRMGYSSPEFVRTWEIVEINPYTKDIIHSRMNLRFQKEKSRCFFEWVYFADPKTILWWSPASLHRYRLGQVLAQQDQNEGFNTEETVVIDVPMSARYSAEGYAESMWLPLVPAIVKSPNTKRTFIAEDIHREKMIREKYIFNLKLKPFIQWKKVVLVDDSIVRGATMVHLVEAFRKFYEPLEIHIRIPSPPIVAPCFYGINMAKTSELIARSYFKDINSPTPEELQNLAQGLHSESIRYISLNGLMDAMRLNIDNICKGCTTWNYPTSCGQREYGKQCP